MRHSLPGDFADLASGIKLEEEPSTFGWKLISRSLAGAFTELAYDYRVDIRMDCPIEEIATEDLEEQLNEIPEREDLFLDRDFFKAPGRMPLLKEVRPVLKTFLESCGVREPENVVGRLKSYFTFALVKEWRSNYKQYQLIKDQLYTPFDLAASREAQWYQYKLYLQRQVDEPVFIESFSLNQIYIPMRGACRIKTEEERDSLRETREKHYNKEEKWSIFDLMEEMLAWQTRGDREKSLRIIRGGPGYGKSSFLKMFAARLSEQDIKVLFIPLHRFVVKEDLKDGVELFLEEEQLELSDPFKEERLVLLFDGLDELSMQGNILTKAATQFITEVERKLAGINNRDLRLQVVIAGRDVVVQQNESSFRKEGQVIRLLPYVLEDEFKEELVGGGDLIESDQRDLWWERYGRLKNKEYKGLPEALKTEELREITALPLLNYLLALSYDRGKLDFSETNSLNSIYFDLLGAVYDRTYDPARTHSSIKILKFEQFLRILEEIALSTWHGDGRKTTVGEIEKHFGQGGLKRLLEQFVKDAEKGVINLFTAFYFRQSGYRVCGSETFEFTHKSFGEYLLARRLIKALKRIHEELELQKQDYDRGWDMTRALEEWARIFGPRKLDPDVVRFLRGEIEGAPKEELDQWQQTIIELINRVLKAGMPMERLTEIKTFQTANKRAVNGETALVVLHSIIARKTEKVLPIEWQEETQMGEWLNRLKGQRSNPGIFILKFLNHLWGQAQVLDYQDFINANLLASNLYKVSFRFTNLREADLKGIDLKKADLLEVNLQGANLRRAGLQGADLRGAGLQGADLQGAGLQGADLQGAGLQGTVLQSANLENTNLQGANLKYANLWEANLWNANLWNANLCSANLCSANLQRSDLEDVNLERADLENANLHGANLMRAKLANANLQGADLQCTNLQGVFLPARYKEWICLMHGIKNADTIHWVE